MGLDVVDVEDAGPISLSPSVTRRQSQQTWLVHITLESGHGLAIRDRTGNVQWYLCMCELTAALLQEPVTHMSSSNVASSNTVPLL